MGAGTSPVPTRVKGCNYETGGFRHTLIKTFKTMIGRMNRGEDIEFYANKQAERQEVLRKMHESSDQEESFPEEDERESRKTATMQKAIY